MFVERLHLASHSGADILTQGAPRGHQQWSLEDWGAGEGGPPSEGHNRTFTPGNKPEDAS